MREFRTGKPDLPEEGLADVLSYDVEWFDDMGPAPDELAFDEDRGAAPFELPREEEPATQSTVIEVDSDDDVEVL